MNRDLITITISGTSGSGKSSISYLLKKFLEQEGINVNFEHDIDYKDELHFEQLMEKNLIQRKDVLKKKIITLNTIQTNRNTFTYHDFKKLPKKVRRRYKLNNLDI